jgi:HPt (histidine-containing phosphotransfer) domain-containing protein
MQMTRAQHSTSHDRRTGRKSIRQPGPSPFECPSCFSEWRDEPEFLQNLFRTFIATTEKDLESLEAAMESRDAAKVAGIAHRIKGGAAAVGAEPMRREAERIEVLGRGGRLPAARQCAASLHEEFRRFCSFVSKLAAPPVV